MQDWHANLRGWPGKFATLAFTKPKRLMRVYNYKNQRRGQSSTQCPNIPALTFPHVHTCAYVDKSHCVLQKWVSLQGWGHEAGNNLSLNRRGPNSWMISRDTTDPPNTNRRRHPHHYDYALKGFKTSNSLETTFLAPWRGLPTLQLLRKRHSNICTS